ncbi:MbtH family protein [Paraburkholderia sp. B3]|uniref:MbtH family protein n=1 Tax=Paraburkholderia sp. B3 TaxID=3134791 RepID=UPI0039821739
MSWGDENTQYHVVVNHEEQYSIWPDYKALPAGWRADGKTGTKDECLAHIEAVWTDMRPLSLRQAMAQYDASGTPGVPAAGGAQA